jgi:glutamate synthase (ferredoxin)
MVFLSQKEEEKRRGMEIIEELLRKESISLLTFREVPINPAVLGNHARAHLPKILQVFVEGEGTDEEEHRLYRARKRMEKKANGEGIPLYFASLSYRTVVYKGLVLAHLLSEFYLDLKDPRWTGSWIIFHQRYSTNTFPSWKLAQPFRLISHNGEINTLLGNISWMEARENALRHFFWGEGSEEFEDVIDLSGSDSAILDNALELLVQKGYSITEALRMMIPPAWEKAPEGEFTEFEKAFYRYAEHLMEPWDGPAAVTFSDGKFVGLLLDRNGLRPARFCVTEDGVVVAASEAGVVDLPEEKIVEKGMVAPGEMIVADLTEGVFHHPKEVEEKISRRRNYPAICKSLYIPLPPENDLNPYLSDLTDPELHRKLVAFGYTHEEEIMVIRPMVSTGKEPVGSMGDDTPLAVLSEFPRPLFHYFKQRFAQVTNPPIDPIREESMMSLRTLLGPRGNFLNPQEDKLSIYELPSPILDPAQFQKIKNGEDRSFPVEVLSAVFPVEGGESSLIETVELLKRKAQEAVERGVKILIISDRGVNEEYAPVPSLLAVSAIHHHLVDQGLRLSTSLVLDVGEPREVHHFACLIGYGADGIYPYLLFSMGLSLLEEGGRQVEGFTPNKIIRNLISAINEGILKIMAKMGISPLASYRGAKIFEAIGLSRSFVETYFPRTPTQIEGVGIERIAKDVVTLHRKAYGDLTALPKLPSYGFYKYKKGGEPHAFSPEVISAIHKAVGLDHRIPREKQTPPPLLQEITPEYREFVRLCTERPPIHIRDLLGFSYRRPPVPLEEVEPVSSICARFSTAAMSHGALSTEAHETIAIALNRLGGKSNSGEGGEGEERYETEKNSRIKQVASGRFGVTAQYLNSADELQIKMAQGSKPGEGGQLPGHKVSEEIARIRHTRPGVALISPPPHHDIYSIEDLAQLIYDLKQINPTAEVSVKLVSEVGVGTIAAGVAKGHADIVHISGHSGGTGASPLSSIKNAGLPWELGLKEAQQVLIKNQLRGRVKIRVDGTFQTGRDVVIAALLGADEVSFGTIAMVAEGCIMARACHTNNCPVGVATQKLELRKKFPGLPEHVMNYFLLLAMEVREIMAQLGFKTFDEMVGRSEFLRQVVYGEEAHHLDLSPLLVPPEEGVVCRYNGEKNDPPYRKEDVGLLLVEWVEEALKKGSFPVVLGEKEPIPVCNEDRTVGARLTHFLLKKIPHKRPYPGMVTVHFRGYGGQSFGAFLMEGIRFILEGGANDYVGKGLSGGEIIIRPFSENRFPPHKNVIVGNTVLYGATSGRLFAAGRAGQRFAVRNSGAIAVIEGASHHCCEYMTGGKVVVLGTVGMNFGAGMTGGVAYVWDPDDTFLRRNLNSQLVEATREIPENEEEELYTLLVEHEEFTRSPKAREILKNWEKNRHLFFRVAPKALVAQIESRNEGVVDLARAKAG